MKEKEIHPEQEESTQEMNTEPISAEQTAESEIETLKIEVAEQKDKFIRLYAEFDNFKRRSAKERIEMMQTAGKEVIQSLLEVMDDFDRAEKQIQGSDDITQIRQGIALVVSKFRNTLTSRGLKEMNCVGQDFNPDFHEAITEIDVEENMKGKVFDELEKGYTLNDKIIRFSKVVVGK
ncbi:MAG: nucleotide exchange factor GrpE [Chitinophagaceae bacterium]|nr:MAG: nucleotide exchange factor GrpE [Chitinophagaceae bacterium]